MRNIRDDCVCVGGVVCGVCGREGVRIIYYFQLREYILLRMRQFVLISNVAVLYISYNLTYVFTSNNEKQIHNYTPLIFLKFL